MLSSHVIVRSFPGFPHPGVVVESSGWLHTQMLEDDRYIRRLDSAEVASAVACEGGCGSEAVLVGEHFCVPVEEAVAQEAQEAASALAEPTAEPVDAPDPALAKKIAEAERIAARGKTSAAAAAV